MEKTWRKGLTFDDIYDIMVSMTTTQDWERRRKRWAKWKEQREARMTLARFITYIQYSTVCPTDINPHRWAAMINSAKKNGFFA